MGAELKGLNLTPDVWTPESGQLTPTMKMKRNDNRIHVSGFI